MWGLFYALRSGPLASLLGLAAGGYAALIAADSTREAICGQGGGLAGRAAGWLLMIAAMMPPLLAGPVHHVWHSSFPSRRLRALAVFGLGYGAVWLAAGGPLAIAASEVRIAPGGGVLITLASALVWSGSPAGQAARNRCHRLRRVGAFGWAADRDCLAFGLAVGGACAAACWAWMLLALTVERHAIAAMAAIGAAVFIERLRPPGPVRWSLPPVATTLSGLVRAVARRLSA